MAGTPIGRILLMPQGDYSGTATYNSLDWVRDNGAAWVCKVDGTVGIAPPTLPTTFNANWTLLSADGSVTGSVDWSNINYKPFNSVKANGGLVVNASNELLLDVDMLTASNITYDNTGSGMTAADVQAAIDELKAGGGGGGATTLGQLTDVTIVSPSDDEVLTFLSGSWVNKPAPTGGHNMIANTPENTLISTIDGALTSDNNVVSAYGIKKWSNAEVITLWTTVAQGDDTVGQWDDDWTTAPVDRTGWIWHECLYHLLSDNDVEMQIVFDPKESEIVSVYAWRYDDDYQHGGDNGGCVAIKLNSAVQSASGIKVGIKLKRQRNQTINVTPLT